MLRTPLSMYALLLTTAHYATHCAPVYGASNHASTVAPPPPSRLEAHARVERSASSSCVPPERQRAPG